MSRQSSWARPGMSLVELLVTMVVAGLLLQGVVSFFIGQSRMIGQSDSERTAREAVRGAMHVFTADLRKVEAEHGIISHSASSVTIRVPFAMGLVCESTASAATLTLLPVDPTMYENAAYSGYVWRSGAGGYVDVPAGGLTAGATTDCTDANVRVYDEVVSVSPGPGAVPVGTPVFLYQSVKYEFKDGAEGATLVRTVVATGEEQELVQYFDEAESRFRYITGAGVQDAPVANPAQIQGLQIVLEGLGDRPRPGGSVATAPLTPSVYFKN